MIKKSILAAALTISVISLNAQIKVFPTKKEATLTLDSAETYALLNIIQTAGQGLMQTSIPANQVSDIVKHGQDIFSRLIPIWQSWQPKPVIPTKTDSTAVPKK